MTITLSVAGLLAALFGGANGYDARVDGSPVELASGETVNFGDDSGEFPNDGECDDPRFVGDGMATSTDTANIGRDASDCLHHFEIGNVRLARTKAESSVAECAAIDYGNDASEWARDGECDDPRFTGPGSHSIANIDDLRTDATDCRALCESGAVWLK